MKQPNIAILGDNFIDHYWIGTSIRLSPEAPIPVVKLSEEKVFPGGAGNVCQNLIALGAQGITIYPERPAIKNRLYSDTHQLARWDEWDEQEELPVDKVKEIVADAVIISDYGKGSITYAVIEAIAALNLPTFIDTKRSPREFDVIQNPTFFPNQKEFNEHLQDYRIQPSVILKRGADGIQALEFGKVVQEYPSWAKKVVSVCGAGDTVIAAYVYAYTTWKLRWDDGEDPIYSALPFANQAAAVVVEKPWTATASIEEIAKIEQRLIDGIITPRRS